MTAPRIMVVEDEVIVAMELESRLTALGYAVAEVVRHGEDAIEKAAEVAPDLLLMDITLAGKVDGIEAATRIHEAQDIPVVYLTAHSDEQTLQRAKLSTPFGYLVKPFSETELRTTIEVSLYRHQQEKRERERAEWFTRTVNTLGGAVIATTDSGVIRHMNALAETLTGTNWAQAVGKRLGDVLHLIDPDTGSPLEDLMPEEHAHGFISAPTDCFLVPRCGAEMPIEISIMAVRDAQGRGSTILYCFRENTQDPLQRQDWVSWAANLRLAGALSRSDERYQDAESFYKRALDVLEKNLGTDHPRVAGLLNDLALVCKSQGKRDEADVLELRASRIHSQSAAGKAADSKSRSRGKRFPA